MSKVQTKYEVLTNRVLTNFVFLRRGSVHNDFIQQLLFKHGKCW